MGNILRRLVVLIICAALVVCSATTVLAVKMTGSEESDIAAPSVGEDEGFAENKAATDVTVLIERALEIIGQTEDCGIDIGTDLDLMVTVRGTAPIKYKWEVSYDGGKTWVVLVENGDSNIYPLKDAQTTNGKMHQEQFYRVTVSDEKGDTDSTIIKVLVADGYEYRRVWVPGDDSVVASAYMHRSVVLVNDPIDEDDSVYDKLLGALEDGKEALGFHDLALKGRKIGDMPPYYGKIKLEFKVPSKYNSYRLTAVFYINGQLVKYSGIVDGCKLIVYVDRLDPCMLMAPEGIPDAPTGDDTPDILLITCWTLLGLSGGVMVTMLFLMFIERRKKDEENETAEAAGV